MIRLEHITREHPPARIFVANSGPFGSDRYFYFTGEVGTGRAEDGTDVTVYQYEQGRRTAWATIDGMVVSCRDIEPATRPCWGCSYAPEDHPNDSGCQEWH